MNLQSTNTSKKDLEIIKKTFNALSITRGFTLYVLYVLIYIYISYNTVKVLIRIIWVINNNDYSLNKHRLLSIVL